jgi:hypothetical protein
MRDLVGTGDEVVDALRRELEEARRERDEARAALRAQTETFVDDDGALRLRSEPDGRAWCKVCFVVHGRKIQLMVEREGAGYWCQACGERWIRPSRARAFSRAIPDDTQW